MLIIMHCMGMPFNGTTIETESLGGSESAAYYVAKHLATMGHKVMLFTTHKTEGEWDGVRYLNVGEIDQQHPLGFNFHFYAMNTPHDVCIIQRHPLAFAHKWASKINIWWTHDLALYRQAEAVNSMMWNVDAVFTVSQYHKDQIVEVYGFNPEVVYPILNGVDRSIFSKPSPGKDQRIDGQLVYSSRPERGLVNLVKPGGIMEKLGNDYTLKVCCYENTTAEMAPAYKELYGMAEALPNVELLGSLNKSELAVLQEQSVAMVYPTTFEEVSCITAMEAMAAGLPVISSFHAALPETCRISEGVVTGAALITLKGDGVVDEDLFVDAVIEITNDQAGWDMMHKAQLEMAEYYDWSATVDFFDLCIQGLFLERQTDATVFRQLIQNSDAYVAFDFGDDDYTEIGNDLSSFQIEKALKAYTFAIDDTFPEHYEAYYAYEKERGIDYGPESLDRNPRFECVSDLVSKLVDGDMVLDYGCAHGHYTVNLALRHPKLRFIGVDLEESNIVKAAKWADAEQLNNVTFVQGDATTGEVLEIGVPPSLIIVAEVLEHVKEPTNLISNLATLGQPTVQFCITTPFGPWEAEGYEEHFPWRAHVWHFEREDLQNLFGKMEKFSVNVLPSGMSKEGEMLGSYLTTFTWMGEYLASFGTIDTQRKIKNTLGRDSVTLCMIVKDSPFTLATAIESALPLVDEVIIAIDDTGEHVHHIMAAVNMLEFKYPLTKFENLMIESPLSTGFDYARNQSIEHANGEWILWMDADEVIYSPLALRPYLKKNQFAGFAIPQHHFSIHPLTVLRTDLPVRIFRNNLGIKFFGRVHEHPEIEMNEGVGHATLAPPTVRIAHHGYHDEDVRRERFSRNYTLMERDREEYPTRVMGKMLWIRDTSQMIGFAAESGLQPTQKMYEDAVAAVKLWRELLDDNLRMASEALEFYTPLVTFVNPPHPVDCSVDICASFGGIDSDPGETNRHQATFYDTEHARAYIDKVQDEQLANLNSRYY